MDLAERIQDFSSTYNALLDLGKNRLPFYQGIKDARINLLVEKGYLIPGISRVHLDEGKTVNVTHYKRTPKGQRALFFAQIPEKIKRIPSEICYKIDCFLHPDD
ncbi:hypothetical protein HYT25_02325 [Candidatus Pacearchaeota archaeon]|nr:hypothetical protein [Candidatus Pacearchaeota archaeon]